MGKARNYPPVKRTFYYPLVKRLVDIVVSSVGVIMFIIMIPFIWVAVKLDSPGPVIFGQKRIGKFGKPFRMFKIRTMLENAEELAYNLLEQSPKSGPFIQQAQDPRVTRVGAFLRRFSLDEFPQFFNILAGQMSFIGPRPFVEEEAEALEEAHQRRHSVRPGLTGYAQINGRSDLSQDERQDYDLYYIDNITILLDMQIFFRTIWVTIMRKGAY